MVKSLSGDQDSPLNNLFNITIEGFYELQKTGLSLDQIFLLYCIKNDVNLNKHTSSEKIAAWTQGLIRKGYITIDEEISNLGDLLLISLSTGKSFTTPVPVSLKEVTKGFEDWWKAYPSTDMFEHKGKQFQGSRGLRIKKEECRILFKKIVEEGTHSTESLVKALEYEVLIKKEDSLRKGENKLSYMQSTLTYLRSRTFENFVDIPEQKKLPGIGKIVDI